MIFGFFRRGGNNVVIDRLYAAIVSASRQPGLYAGLAIPDTFEGRFESLTLHAFLVLRRLKSCEAPGPEMAQHLVDTVFRHFDRTLREMGVGDTSVPKRMKGLAEAFLGRSRAYEEALRGAPDEFAAALRRNVYMDERDASSLAHYARDAAETFARTPLQAFIDGTVLFPGAVAEAKETAA